MAKKIRIAHLAGPNATITNTPALVTSNKARAKYGLPLLTDIEDQPSRFDVLRPQRLAAPTVIYVEQFSAHPLESDAADLYAPPDGYCNEQGEFSQTRKSASDRPVYRIEIGPQDGLYPMPYMARQLDGSAWETDGVSARSPREQSRQPFLPDGARVFEEIDRLGIGRSGTGNLISNNAVVDFYRIAPAGGYMKGLAANRRTDVGEGDIAPETPGKDFFPYRPPHLQRSPSRVALARITNLTQKVLASGKYDGAIWTQGSPRIEETMYWFNLALDVTVPLCGSAAQRYHGMISNDGPKNIADCVEYLHSRIWADREGRNHVGMVLIQDQRVFAARDVMKVDARPGGYVATGGHGGIIGSVGGQSGAMLRYIPATSHTYMSEVNITRLPEAVDGVKLGSSRIDRISVVIKDSGGDLLGTAIPKVSIIKDATFGDDSDDIDLSQEVDVAALMDYKLRNTPLAGFVLEGLSPYGTSPSPVRTRALARAVYTGFPVVCVGRGNTEGFATPPSPFIGASNLTATKARLLLMLCIMKFGMHPVACDPERPTADEIAATQAHNTAFQAIFATH